MVPSHAIKVVKGNFVHVQPQTPVCKLAFQNYALHPSFYEFLLVVPLPSLFPCPSSACRHSRLWTGLTLAVIGSDTSSCQLVLRVTRVAEILLIGSGFKQSVCSFVFGAICRHDLHQPPAPVEVTPSLTWQNSNAFSPSLPLMLQHGSLPCHMVPRWRIKH